MLNDAIIKVEKPLKMGLMQDRFDPESLRMVCSAGASFANKEDGSTQIGYDILLKDENGSGR